MVHKYPDEELLEHKAVMEIQDGNVLIHREHYERLVDYLEGLKDSNAQTAKVLNRLPQYRYTGKTA